MRALNIRLEINAGFTVERVPGGAADHLMPAVETALAGAGERGSSPAAAAVRHRASTANNSGGRHMYDAPRGRKSGADLSLSRPERTADRCALHRARCCAHPRWPFPTDRTVTSARALASAAEANNSSTWVRDQVIHTPGYPYPVPQTTRTDEAP